MSFQINPRESSRPDSQKIVFPVKTHPNLGEILVLPTPEFTARKDCDALALSIKPLRFVATPFLGVSTSRTCQLRAIYHQRMSAHHCRLVRRCEQDCVGHILGRGDAPDRNEARH